VKSQRVQLGTSRTHGLVFLVVVGRSAVIEHERVWVLGLAFRAAVRGGETLRTLSTARNDRSRRAGWKVEGGRPDCRMQPPK